MLYITFTVLFIYCTAAVPQVALEPVAAIILNNINSNITFVATCGASGIPAPMISWLFDDRQINPSSSNIEIQSSFNNNIVSSTVTISDIGVSEIWNSSIVCSASNVVQSVRDQQALYVAGKIFV